jgi:hypothetical protein
MIGILQKVTILALLILPTIANADDVITVQGQACYMYGDNETPLTAKKSSLMMAKQAAVENYRVFVSSSSQVDMGELKEDLISSVSGGFLYGLKVVKQYAEGREICTSVTAQLNVGEVDDFIKNQLAKQKAGPQTTKASTYEGTSAPIQKRKIPDHCRDVLDTTVRVEDNLRQGSSRLAIRDRLLKQATSEAVRQALGVKTRSNSSMELSSHNDKEDEKFQMRMISQSKGLVTYEVEDEGVEKMDGDKYMWVRIQAHVCVPKDATVLKEVVRIDKALTTKGKSIPQFRDILEEIFSNAQAYALAGPQDSFADVVVSGRINSKKMRTISQGKRIRFDINLTIKALLTGDGAVVTHTINDYYVIPAHKDSGVEGGLFVMRLIRKSAEELHDKLLNRRAANGDSIPTKARIIQAEPEW